MRHEQNVRVWSQNQQAEAYSSVSLDMTHLLEALAKAQSENEILCSRVEFLTKQIEDLRSQSHTSELDYDVLAEKVVQRIQTEMPTPELQKLDQIEDLLQMLQKMRDADGRVRSDESAHSEVRPDPETEVTDQLHAIRDEIQRLSAARS